MAIFNSKLLVYQRVIMELWFSIITYFHAHVMENRHVLKKRIVVEKHLNIVIWIV